MSDEGGYSLLEDLEDYFMACALLTAKLSKDPVTKVGACIVDKEDRILAVGYNRFPKNCEACSWTVDKGLFVVHAEANAILNKNAADISGARIYTTLFPCNECTKLLIQSGIKEVVYISDKYSWKHKYQASKTMLDAAEIKYRRYEPKQRRIVLDFDEYSKEDSSVEMKNTEVE